MHFRDEAFKILGARSGANDIPAEVLRALRLTTPVPAISRCTTKRVYLVSFVSKGKSWTRRYGFKYVPEEDAYAMAIEFLEGTLKKKSSL